MMQQDDMTQFVDSRLQNRTLRYQALIKRREQYQRRKSVWKEVDGFSELHHMARNVILNHCDDIDDLFDLFEIEEQALQLKGVGPFVYEIVFRFMLLLEQYRSESDCHSDEKCDCGGPLIQFSVCAQCGDSRPA
ncbi:MAG: hypothetical protein ACPGXK_00090 [Phycisphaerae bacterium]